MFKFFCANLKALLLYLFISSSFSLYCHTVDRDIESAYRDVFTNELGYTLIGVKPVSLDELQYYYLHINPGSVKKFIESLGNTFKDSNSYVFKWFNWGENYFHIELVHKKSLRALLSKSEFLKAIIKKKFDNIDTFFSMMENPSFSVFDINNELAVGLLLGYGEESSKHYCRFCSVGEYLRKRPFVRWHNSDINMWTCLLQNDLPGTIYLPYTVKAPKPNLKFDSLESEWEWLKSIDWDLFDMIEESRATPPCFINLPYYRCRKSSKSYALRAKYIQAREKLAKVFQGKSYQEAVRDMAR